MVTLPANMFNTVTLPATLWFFDKTKVNSERKDKILFIDARNIFTQIDRAHRNFSDEQIKNLGIITRLYDGDTKAFEDLLSEYESLKTNAPVEPTEENKKTKDYFQNQINWLLERFPNHKYQDVIGLCKVVEIGEVLDDQGNVKEIIEDSIADQDWSLNAGRYVGVVIEDDGMTEDEFKDHMKSLNDEFEKLSAEAKALENAISANLKGLFGD